MNKVISVDPDSASCLLEPGVSYFDLYEHLNAVGLGEALWVVSRAAARDVTMILTHLMVQDVPGTLFEE